ncbi:MAG: ribokinase [Erysipelotrichaceae bacterium]
MKKIVVIGSINVDLFITTNKIPKVGETVSGEDFKFYQGGKGANQAVAASRLGVDVSFIGAVGDDQNGINAIKNLENEGIDVTGVEIVNSLPTGVANVISCDGDNSIIVVEGANGIVDSNFITKREKLIKAADIVLIQNEIPICGVKRVLELARDNGIISIYNPAPYVRGTEKISHLATYCTPNALESRELANEDNLIITLGENGVEYNHVVYPANKVKVVDTTGAGDTFNGALCASLLNDFSIEEAIKFGIKASGISIGFTGAQSGMPFKEVLNHEC